MPSLLHLSAYVEGRCG